MINNTVTMFKFVVLALLVISHLGDTSKPKIHNSVGLYERHNDESSKELYRKVVTEFPEFVLKNTEICDKYDKDFVRVTLYSGVNPHGYQIFVDVEGSLNHSSYDVNKPTKIIVSPKYGQYYNSSELVTAYLRHHNEPVNVITVNYEKFFGCNFDRYVKIHDDLTDTIAYMVKLLHSYGSTFEKIHIIGFGMSAHLIGSVAKKLHPYKIGHVTGLDPSGGMFDQISWLGELSDDDADFVDIILTNTGKYGTKKERGNVHFYPNGGERQPGSNDMDSHLKALKYFVESVVRPGSFKSYNAHSWSDFLAGNTLHTTTYMGEHVSLGVHGKFFNKVNAMPPFSIDGKDNSFDEQVPYTTRGQLFEITQKGLKKEGLGLEQNLLYTKEGQRRL